MAEPAFGALRSQVKLIANFVMDSKPVKQSLAWRACLGPHGKAEADYGHYAGDPARPLRAATETCPDLGCLPTNHGPEAPRGMWQWGQG